MSATSNTDTSTKPKASKLVKRINWEVLLPAVFPFLTWLGKLGPQTLKIDFYAAVTSAIFALPQGVAFALIAGLPPEFGLYAAVVAPVVTAFFGSSWHAVSGPTVATSIVILSILSDGYAVPQSPQFIGLALMLTLTAGLLQLALGIFRLGHIVNFISHTVILGFSTGAAMQIIGSQLSQFLGISFTRQENLLATLYETYKHLVDYNQHVFFLSASTLLVAIVCKLYFKNLPYLLIAMFYGAAAAAVMVNVFDVQGLDMVGALPGGLPSIIVPELTWFQMREFFASAIALATLGLIQAVSISKTISIKTGQHIDSNQEFIGQGLANIACSMTSGFFSSCSFTRTGVNYGAGAVTPASSIMASGLILSLLLFASGLTAYLPTATMSAIIVVIGWGLVDFSHIRKLLKTSYAEASVFFVTFASTLLLSLEFAIYSGMFLSLIMYLQKTSSPKVAKLIVDTLDPYHRLIPLSKRSQNPHPKLSIVRVEGSVFFGSVDHIRSVLENLGIMRRKNILLIFTNVNVIDISGAELLVLIKKACKKNGGDLYFSSLTPEVRRYLLLSPYWKELGGRNNFFNYQSEAVTAITQKIEHTEELEAELEATKSDENNSQQDGQTTSSASDAQQTTTG